MRSCLTPRLLRIYSVLLTIRWLCGDVKNNCHYVFPSSSAGGATVSVGDGDGGQTETGGGHHGVSEEAVETGSCHGAEPRGGGRVSQSEGSPHGRTRLGERGQGSSQTEVSIPRSKELVKIRVKFHRTFENLLHQEF